MAEKLADKSTPSISGSLGEVAGSVANMFRLNISMLRLEMSQKAARAMRAAVILVLAIAVLVIAISYAIFAIYLLLANYGFSPFAAAWMVAGGSLAIGGFLAVFAIAALVKLSPVPERTFAEFGRNIDVIKANIRSGGDA